MGLAVSIVSLNFYFLGFLLCDVAGYFDHFFLDGRLEIFLRDFLDGRREMQRDLAHGGYEWLLDEVHSASKREIPVRAGNVGEGAATHVG